MSKSFNLKLDPERYIPELLSPAGNMECFESALNFGADAVYLGAKEFGMRAAPENFSIPDLVNVVKSAHDIGVKVYLTTNIIPRNNEINRLPSFFENVMACGIDALIITDLGVLDYAKKYAPDVDIHISTQLGVTNFATANMLFELGAKRIVLSRELNLDEIYEIHAKIPKELEIECFVHGAMCMSFSGRCLLSNYLTGRDSNHGDCAQPCRWKYNLVEETRPGEYIPISEDDDGTYIFNSKDLCMINHIPDLIKAGVSSFKIEGRAKSSYYTATVTNAYRCAIDEWKNKSSEDFQPSKWILDEMAKISNRKYCTGYFFEDVKDDAHIFYEGGYKREWDIVAIAESFDGDSLTVIQRNRFFEGDELEVLEPGKEPFSIIVKNLKNIEGESIDAARHPMMKAKFDCRVYVKKHSLLRRAK